MTNEEPPQAEPSGLPEAGLPDSSQSAEVNDLAPKEFHVPIEHIAESDTDINQPATADQPPDTIINNKEKAEVMAYAEKNVREHIRGIVQPEENESAENIKNRVARMSDYNAHHDGDYYELEAVAQWFGKSSFELSTLMHENLKAFCDYGHVIIEHQKAFGEKLTIQQQAFELVNAFLQEHLIIHREEMNAPVEGNAYTVYDKVGNIYIVEGTTAWLSGGVRTSFRFSFEPRDYKQAKEEWLVSPFVINNEDSTGYTITENTTEVEDFDTFRTIKSRKLTDKDVERLREVVKGYTSL
jgi:hypothetical protein